ncbi:MAG TPA: hypothetical protein VMJ12_00995, partial [Candidatus Acidoferrales bacterium]|nr:hypothetical protein [Candidatus Acidoferrales bacterium]
MPVAEQDSGIEVDVPGVGLVTFPEGMSTDDIKAVIGKKTAPPLNTVPKLTLPAGVKPERVNAVYDVESKQPMMDFIKGGIEGVYDLATHPFTRAQQVLDYIELPKGVKPAPFVNPFRIEVGPGMRQELRPYAEGVAATVNKFTDPDSLAQLAFAPLKIADIPAAVGKLFVAQMGAQLPEKAAQLGTILGSDASPDEKKKAITEMGLDTAITYVAGRGMVKGPPSGGPPGPPAPSQAELPPELAQAAKALPRTAEAAKQAIAESSPTKTTTTEVSDASSKQKTAEIHGDVQSQPGGGEGKLPVEESGGGVLPQTGGRLPEEANPTGAQPAPREVDVKTYPNPEAAKPDAVPLKPGDEAPVRFVSVQPGATHIGWYEPTKPFLSNDGGLYYPAEGGKVKISSSQLGNAGFKIPEAELAKFKEAGGTEKAAVIPVTPAEPIVDQTVKKKEESALEPIPAGPGAATRPDLVPGGPDLPVEPGNPDTYGVAERVRKEREAAGQTAPTQPGQGISAPDSVEHGRQLLDSGVDPEKVMSDFEKTKRLSADDMAVVRAHGEALAKAARNIEEKFGTNSPEYKVAWDALSAWDKRSKTMQTEWHKTGQAQQGETDIDTGSFTGLQRAHKELTGDDFTPKQAVQAKRVVKKVKAAKDTESAAKKQLFDHLNKENPPRNPKQVDAEKRALAAASKTVRDAAVRLADAETKRQVADKVRQMAAEKLADAQKNAGLKARDKTVRDAAVRAAKAEEKAAIKAADLAKRAAETARKAEADAKAAVEKFHRDAAARAAKAEREAMADPQRTVWNKVRDYIEQGVDDFDDIRNKVATDLGMKAEQVTRLITQAKQSKRLADDVWQKQLMARRVQEQARRWLTAQSVPGYQRALSAIPRILFGLKVGFHGTVALGTHAPMVAFQPRFWSNYVRDFGKMYRMVGSRAYYERQVQDLVRRPNYITARRAGLVNDPFTYEDYNSPDTAAYFGGLSGMGNRGYAILKVLRQDMFDQMWNQLPRTAQIPEVAQAVADGLNHATGVVKGMAPKGSNLALFAPRLMASRAMWLAGDPVKAADTFLRWNTATEGEKTFALNQVKEKAWVLGTAYALLNLNQGILSATGSKQKINFTDPMKSDFMKFKVAGMNLAYGNAMLTMARLPFRLFQIRASSGGKTRNLIYPDEDVYSVLGEYARSQMSPFASLVADLWFRSDWMRRQLPGSNRPMPARLRKQGIKPYTWPEFLSEQFLPIPAEEAVREVWQHGLGMSPQQISSM